MQTEMAPDAYLDDLSDRILAAADDHPMVAMQIQRVYIPLMASDIYRGQIVTGALQGPFEGTLGHSLVEGAAVNPVIALSMPSPMAKILAFQLKAGSIARKRAH